MNDREIVLNIITRALDRYYRIELAKYNSEDDTKQMLELELEAANTAAYVKENLK